MATAANKTQRRKFLTLADIEKAEDRPYIVKEIPEWKGSVRLRPLSAREWEEIQNEAALDGRPEPDELVLKPRVIAAGVVDANGAPLFTPEEADRLLEKNAGVIARVAQEIVVLTMTSLNGQPAAEAERAKQAEATFLAGEAEPEGAEPEPG